MDMTEHNYQSFTNARILDLNDERITNEDFLDNLKRCFLGNGTLFRHENSPIDMEKFSILLSGILLLVTTNEKKFSFKILKDCIVLSIHKTLEYTNFQLFIKLFEELTLERLNFIQFENKWGVKIYL
jgi:hypothetical protein